MIHVAVGVIRKPDGRVLITRRAGQTHQGGRWEFPGGKVEPEETACAALARELYEELGIRPLELRPLLRVPWRYPEKDVLLDVWEVRRFSGAPQGREGQPLRWVPPAELPHYRFPDANAAIVTAATLPETYLITPDTDAEGVATFLEHLRSRIAAGIRLVQLRVPGLGATARHRLAGAAAESAREYGACLLVNGDVDLARNLGLGVHLRAAQLTECPQRPLPVGRCVAASCHDRAELEQAVALGVDFAVLGPVQPTASHPGRAAMGAQAFAECIADVPIPVYALGGLGVEDIPAMRESRAQGIAAIRGLWHAASGLC
ncbi:Nudix family hydrolase [Aquisalimonas sp.]|uniref:Nudix family hydrolase n=1 Tax=Aquisalimonas sp. TaxID=1872621 RepID=UPI0025BAEC93|nr:Nudix family hydrolase [Aquisalimonas sp.]